MKSKKAVPQKKKIVGMTYECPINMKYKEVSLLSTAEFNEAGYIPLYAKIRARHNEVRNTTRHQIPWEISGDPKQQQKPKYISEFDVIEKGVDCHLFLFNPTDGIEKMQEFLNQNLRERIIINPNAPKKKDRKVKITYEFYVIELGVKHIETGDVLIWVRQSVTDKEANPQFSLEERKGLTLKFINGRERDKPDGPSEKELWDVGEGLAEDRCVMGMEEGVKYVPFCILPT